MGRRIAVGAVWVIAGLAIAGGLITGAFALAGEDIADPATPDMPISTDDHSASPTLEPDRTRTPEADRGDGGADPSGEAPGPGSDDGDATADDNSGSSSGGDGEDNSGPGSGSDGGGDDSSGSGSGGAGDDNSGPGSGDDGGGDDSGSGSSDSGSGSDDHGDD
jgi:hypothetical protein